MKDTYIDPFTDFGFKKIFGEELNKDLLMDFLNELLKGEQYIKNLSYRKTENLGITIIDRKAIFDLYCENDRGEKFIVEIQKTKQRFFKDRTVYYSTFPIMEQAEQGLWDYQLKSVYTIAILDFTFDDEFKDKTVVSHVQLMHTEKKEVFYDKHTFIYLQMPNFTKTEDQLETRFDKWLYIFKNLQKLHSRPARLQEKVFEKLFRISEIARFSPLEREAYQESLKVYRDLTNSFDTAREEGWEKSWKEAKTEEKEKTALRMIQNGISDDIIQLATELPLSEIVRIREHYDKGI